MLKKILICAVIALVLVPASVMAAGYGGKGTGAASGQGQCLQDGQNYVNQTCQQGTGTQAQYRFGTTQNGAAGTTGTLCSGNGQCDNVKKQARSMLRLHDGSRYSLQKQHVNTTADANGKTSSNFFYSAI